MKLLNVRLDAEDSSKVQALRRQGVQISELVRCAIRSEYERRRRALRPADVESMLQEIYAAHPVPADLPPRGFDVHDRRAFREAMARHVRGGKASR